MSDEAPRGPVDNAGKDAGIAARDAAKAAVTETKEVPEKSSAPEVEPASETDAAATQNDPEDSAAREIERKAGKKPGVHQRIDELTREKHEARREADELRKRLEQMEKGAKPATPEAPAAKQPDAKPTLEQFDFDVAKHEAALEQWVRKSAEREFEEKRAKETREAETKRLSAAFTARLQAFEKANPGAWEAATKAPIDVTPPMMEVIATSDHGPEIGVYLAQNLEEAERISKLSPIAAAAALGRIEASFSAPRQPDSKTVTKAPAPVTTLSGAPSVRKSLDDMSMREYHEARQKERAAKGLR